MLKLALTTVTWLLLAACNLAAPTTVTPTQMVVPSVRIAQASVSPVPTLEREFRTLPQSSPEPTLETTVACEDGSALVRPQHHIVATIDYSDHVIQISQQISYVNNETDSLSNLMLVADANSWGPYFEIRAIEISGVTPAYTLERNRLLVQLEKNLEPDCLLQVNVTYLLTVPPIGGGLNGYKGYFGYSPRQLNLALWLLTVAPRTSQQWLVHEPALIGEQTVLETADWELSLYVENAPGGMVLAAPGQVEELDEDTHWLIQHDAARDLAISLSPSYRVLSETSRSGAVVEVYSFPDALISTDSGFLDAAQHALRESVRSLDHYAGLFGDYPYERIVVIQGDFPDGMEFSGLVYVSSAWFYAFKGGVDNYLTLITVHEISHQWWYARVGNDAAYAPWLDEALSTYSEYIYFEEYYPELKNWWWSFRVGYHDPQGDVDSDVYVFSTPREYINAVYLRGVQMLHNLREDIGNDEFFQLLSDYVRAGDGTIATPELFWSLLTPEQFELTMTTRTEFLRQPIEMDERVESDE